MHNPLYLKYMCFLPCKHSAVCVTCYRVNPCQVCPLCRQNISKVVYGNVTPKEWVLMEKGRRKRCSCCERWFDKYINKQTCSHVSIFTNEYNHTISSRTHTADCVATKCAKCDAGSTKESSTGWHIYNNKMSNRYSFRKFQVADISGFSKWKINSTGSFSISRKNHLNHPRGKNDFKTNFFF